MTTLCRTAPNFRTALTRDGLHAALAFLNARVDFRFTGVYRFEGTLLRNICLFDRQAPHEQGGGGAPVTQTYCGITGSAGDCIQIVDGRHDPRYPWMSSSSVIAYCGVPVFEPRGDVLGTVCHFDVRPCRIPSRELPTLRAAAAAVWTYCLSPEDGQC